MLAQVARTQEALKAFEDSRNSRLNFIAGQTALRQSPDDDAS